MATTEITTGADGVTLGIAAHVATITLDRPHRRNALNYRAYDQLEAAFRAASGDPEVRCVVVTGADPAFCSGDDVGEIMAGPKRVSAIPDAKPTATPPAMAALEGAKPIIPAGNGAAVAGGLEPALFPHTHLPPPTATSP